MIDWMPIQHRRLKDPMILLSPPRAFRLSRNQAHPDPAFGISFSLWLVSNLTIVGTLPMLWMLLR